jgi:hypothetical protein
MAGAKTSAVFQPGSLVFRMYQTATAKDLPRMLCIVGNVDQEHHYLGAGNRGQRAVDAQIRNGVHIQARLPCKTPRQPKGRQERHGHQHAIRVQE